MWQTLLRWFIGEFLGRVVGNFVNLLRAARADDPSVADFVRARVAEAEHRFGSGTGERKQRFVDVETKKYVATLGREIATAGIHALTLSAMQELGLIAGRFASGPVPPDSARTLGSTAGGAGPQ